MNTDKDWVEPLRLRELFDSDSKRKIWMVLTVGWAICLATAIPIGWVDGLEAAGTGGARIAGSATNVWVPLQGAALACLLLALAARTPWREGFGAQLPARRPVTSTILGVTLVLIAQTGVWFLFSALGPERPSSALSTAAAFRGLSLDVLAASSTYAAFWEETLNIVVPAGMMYVVLWAVNRRRDAAGHGAFSPGLTWALCVAATSVGLVSRYCAHLYQGPSPAVAAVVWGACMIAIFAIFRSVVPLIVGHFLYDFVVAGVLPSTVPAFAIAGGVVVAVGAASIAVSRRPRRVG